MKPTLIFILTVTVFGNLIGQPSKRLFLSLNYKAGVSYNAGYYKKSANAFESSVTPSWGLGYSAFFLTRKDSLKRVVDFIKLNIYAASRGGFFEEGASTFKLNSNFIDLEIVIPMRLVFSEKLDFYLGIGPTVGMIIKEYSSVLSSSGSIESEKIQPGLVVEFGLVSNGLSTLGFRVASSLTKYPIEEISLLCGIGIADLKFTSKRKSLKRK